MNEVSISTNKLRSKLEQDLEMDENGWVSVRKLYEFLGYPTQNYSRWVKRNLTDIVVFEETIDYKPLKVSTIPSEELENTGLKPNYSQDYLISGELAKRFALLAHNGQGEKVRKLYLNLEEDTKQAYIVLGRKFSELQNNYLLLSEKLETFENCIRSLEGLEKLETRWHKSVYDRINNWIEKEEPKLLLLKDPNFIINQIIEKADLDLDVYTREYINKTDDYLPDKLAVIESYEFLKKNFDNALNKFIEENSTLK